MTPLARSADDLEEMASTLANTGATIGTADASEPEGVRDRVSVLYREPGCTGLIVSNAVMGATDELLTSSVTHPQQAYAVDVIGAIVIAQGCGPGKAGVSRSLGVTSPRWLKGVRSWTYGAPVHPPRGRGSMRKRGTLSSRV